MIFAFCKIKTALKSDVKLESSNFENWLVPFEWVYFQNRKRWRKSVDTTGSLGVSNSKSDEK